LDHIYIFFPVFYTHNANCLAEWNVRLRVRGTDIWVVQTSLRS